MKCSICKEHILYSYYMNTYGNGEIYYIKMGKQGNYAEYCRKSDGSRLTCNNSGQCSKCSNSVTSLHQNQYIKIVLKLAFR